MPMEITPPIAATVKTALAIGLFMYMNKEMSIKTTISMATAESTIFSNSRSSSLIERKFIIMNTEPAKNKIRAKIKYWSGL